jgi:hypothetical protein
MNKFKLYFIVSCFLFALFSCNKADDTTYEPLHFYAVQYETDIALIEDFLKTHYLEPVVNHPGFEDDQNVTMAVIPAGNTSLVPIWDSPLLHSKEVEFNNFTYKVYYLQLREGEGEAPTRVDQVLASYDGSYIAYNNGKPENTRFQYAQYPTTFLGLDNTIAGWREMFLFFKTGTVEPAEGPNPAVYNNFGAGVLFLPSALAYYNLAQPAPGYIPAYSPLIFSFKLYDLKHVDHDADGILSNDEDVNTDGDFTNDDTDGDGIQNYLDIDDDGDGYLTKAESKYIVKDNVTHEEFTYYYPFNGAATDDPATPYVDERFGIPRKFSGAGGAAAEADFIDPARLRRHLDPSVYPPFAVITH